MRFLVASDSHGRVSHLLEMIERSHTHRFPADAILFLGDGLRDLSYLSDVGIPVFAVRGNCDFFGSELPSEELLNFEGYRILMTHGDRFSVKSGDARIIDYAVSRGVDIVLHGHTHVPVEHYYPEGSDACDVSLKKPLYVLNPGSIGEARDSFSPGYAVLELTSQGVSWNRVVL